MQLVTSVKDTDTLRKIYRLRYKIYCLELGTETSCTGYEIDEFDHVADNIAVLDDDKIAACSRILLPPASLPFFDMVKSDLPRPSTGEVSRFTVKYKYRRSVEVSLKLMVGIYKSAVEHELTHLVSILEPELIHKLSRFGLPFRKVGPLINYHGPRQPAYLVVDELEESVREPLLQQSAA